MQPRIEFRVERGVWRGNIELRVASLLRDGQMGVAKPMTFEVLPDDGAVLEPCLTMRPEDAQLLMDELWRAGLRPTEGTGSAGSLAATQKHLEDMRAIAMGLLKGEL